MQPVITVRPDKYFDNAAERVAQQGTVSPGETAAERDTGNIYVRTISDWALIGTAGTPHVADMSIGPGQNKDRDRSYGGGRANAYPVTSGSSAEIKGEPGDWHGCVIETATAIAPILLRDGGIAGAIKVIIKPGLAIGDYVALPFAVAFNETIHLDQNGATGKIIPYIN